MIITEYVDMQWTSRNKKYYIDRGYKWTKCFDMFKVSVKDLPPSSNVWIKKTCDYCGKEINVRFGTHTRQSKNKIKKDCCKECSPLKHKEVMMKKYGVESPMHLEEVRNKVSEFNKMNFEYVKGEFLKKSYEIIDNEYIDAHARINFICKKHDTQESMTWNDFQQGGIGCKHCLKESICGENSHLWKGGITPLHNHLRAKIEPWKKDSMKKCSYKCIISGSNFDVIHHLYSFTEIMRETIETLNFEILPDISSYSDNELKLIEDKCLELHYKYGLGVCLTEELHKEFHKIYGQKGFTLEDFEEFKENKIKEFKEEC